MKNTNILEEIVARRREDIALKGFEMGCPVPEKRNRDITPFLPSKGCILEVKRASPSKGDISPLLDAGNTAVKYAESGASAISVLTESHWFKGSLEDLCSVCKAIDEYALSHPEAKKPAVLRKDFLFSEEDIEVAYRCGADAVLLISRILDKDTLVRMASKCQSLGITAFIEIRLEEDVEKLAAVSSLVKSDYIVTGVNARDLKDFSIDLLKPVTMKKSIMDSMGKDARIVFESGIRTEEASAFAGSLGFTGLLLGEAAARNPSAASSLVRSFVNGKVNPATEKWIKYSMKLSSCEKRPFVKICGITNEEDALEAAELGADFLGFVFCAESRRAVDPERIPLIVSSLDKDGLRDKVFLVGVVTDIESPEGKSALKLVKDGVLDFIQLHGCPETIIEKRMADDIPFYPAINIGEEKDLGMFDSLRLLGSPRILLDAKSKGLSGGTGKTIGEGLLDKVSHKTRLWIAGGITPENVGEMIERYNPELIDIASGVEERPGKKDRNRLSKLFDEINIAEEKTEVINDRVTERIF